MKNDMKLKKLGSGSASDGYLLENGQVLIVGKREDSFENYKALAVKDNMINGKITTVNYPKISELFAPCQEYPFGAVIEDYIEGKELREKAVQMTEREKEEVGKRLGVFLSELHSLKLDGNKKVEMEINLKKFDKSIILLSDYLTAEDLGNLALVKMDYKKLMESRKFCTTHGDLNEGNIMIAEDNTLSGIIDFGNMEYYIPEVEFIHMFYFDKTIYRAMVESYGKDIQDKDMVLLELVTNIRHFKNIVNFPAKRKHCLENIKNMLKEYLGENGNEEEIAD